MALSKEEILDAIAEMSVMDIVGLIEAMEEKFGVTAAAAVAAAPAAAAGGDCRAAAVAQTEFDVILTAGGEKKVNVIKVVRADHWPRPERSERPSLTAPLLRVKEGASKDEAEDIKKQARRGRRHRRAQVRFLGPRYSAA